MKSMKIAGVEIDTKAVNERAKRIREDEHFLQQVERVLEPLKMVTGTRDMFEFDGLTSDVSIGVALIEAQVAAGVERPDPVYGPIMVTHSPTSGYDLWVRASTVYDLRMTQREKPRPA